MGTSTIHPLRPDRWYDLQVFDVSVDSEAGTGSYSERIDVVFLAAEVQPSRPGPPSQRGRPKACIALRFGPDWTPQDDGTRELLGCLGVPLPIPVDFDWEKELANRRVVGRFRPSPRRGGRNPLGEVRPVDHATGGRAPGIVDREPADVPGHPSGEVRADDRRGADPGDVVVIPRPRWNGVLLSLTWNGETVARYTRPAPNQVKILSAFEEEGWPPRIDDPLTPGSLRQTLKDLQKKFRDSPIAFCGDGTATGILWEPRAT